MTYVYALVLLTALTAGCGVSMKDPTGKRFIDAKDELYDKKIELTEKKSQLEDAQELTRNTYVKDGKVWIWRASTSTSTFDQAQAECADLEFALPTRAEAEAAVADPKLADAILFEKDTPNSILIYIKDEPNDRTFVESIVCTR